MRIELNKEFQPSEYIYKNTKLLNMQLRKSYIAIAFFGLIGITLIVLENLLNTTENSSDFGLSFTFILLALIILIRTFKARNTSKYFIISQSRKIRGQVKYVITEEEIIYSNNEMELKCKWSYYTHFQLLSDYILITNKYDIWSFNSLMIKKDDIETDSTIKLIELLRNRLSEKKK